MNTDGPNHQHSDPGVAAAEVVGGHRVDAALHLSRLSLLVRANPRGAEGTDEGAEVLRVPGDGQKNGKKLSD